MALGLFLYLSVAGIVIPFKETYIPPISSPRVSSIENSPSDSWLTLRSLWEVTAED